MGAEGAGRLRLRAASTWRLRFRGRDTGRDFPGGMVPRCQVEVLYFAKSAEIAGIRSETISVPQEIKALQLWNEIETRHPGLVPVTEASVIIAVSSAHRAASLEAVSYAIDVLKARVPIWKKEIYEESSSSWKRNKECFWATSD
ncbi:molybdopterin synthase catalytic subunit isoform X3 [Dama dama]|uniref:molybdopterin synthase catalytic subunit isoform X3 n=1 Tax=Dama dama TaxID=30532 RepID=UPI002A371E69|nr:molybdopterin synthase catalytic subunit isoform X3 [Dama dama]